MSSFLSLGAWLGPWGLAGQHCAQTSCVAVIGWPVRHSTPSEAELAKASNYPGHCVPDSAMFVRASSSPLRHPASPLRFETPSPSPLPLPDLLTHKTLLKASEGQDGWSTDYPGAACLPSLPAGAGTPKEKGTLDMVAPTPEVGSGAWTQHLLGWESLVQVRP